MSEIDRILEANGRYAPTHVALEHGRPGRHVAVVTCMDVRIDVAAALGLRLGEAHVIRNAGGRVTDDAIRSLTLSSKALGVDTVVVMEHTKCGLAGVTDAELHEQTGATFGSFLPIADHTEAINADVEALAAIPYLDSVKEIAGFLFDVDTGKVEEIARWQRPSG